MLRKAQTCKRRLKDTHTAKASAKYTHASVIAYTAMRNSIRSPLADGGTRQAAPLQPIYTRLPHSGSDGPSQRPPGGCGSNSSGLPAAAAFLSSGSSSGCVVPSSGFPATARYAFPFQSYGFPVAFQWLPSSDPPAVASRWLPSRGFPVPQRSPSSEPPRKLEYALCRPALSLGWTERK